MSETTTVRDWYARKAYEASLAKDEGEGEDVDELKQLRNQFKFFLAVVFLVKGRRLTSLETTR